MTWFLCLVEIYNTIFVLVTVLFLKYGGENPKLFWVTVDFISLQIVRKRYFMFLQSIIVFRGKKPCSDSLDIIIRWFLHNSLYSSKHLFSWNINLWLAFLLFFNFKNGRKENVCLGR